MPAVIDPDFSVYKLVNRIRSSSTILNHRRTMSRISYEIENATLISGARGRVFGGFQRMSKFLPQIPRYTRLAELSESIYIFGVKDVTPPPIPNIHYVYLKDTDQLAKEWFLVSHGLDYHSILATEELTTIDDADENRMFLGLWTFEIEMVKIVEEWLSSAVDADPLILRGDYNEKRQTQIMSATLERLVSRAATQPTHANISAVAAVTDGQLKTLIKDTISPELRISFSETNSLEQDVVIFFSDMRDFTQYAEKMPPSQLVASVINPYIDSVSRAIYQYGGIVDKFLGDGILAVFGLNPTQDNFVDAALQSAIEALKNLHQRQLLPAVGIGLAYGKVLVGQIGTELVHERTVIGDTVNLAQRLSSMGSNMICLVEDTRQLLKNTYPLISLGEVNIKGKTKPDHVYYYKLPISPN